MENQVSHIKFGIGNIISEDGTNITINFNGIEKTLIIKFANLTNIDGYAYGVQFIAPVKKSKKLNKANFMSAEEFSKSKYSTMSKSDFEEERNKDKWASKSF